MLDTLASPPSTKASALDGIEEEEEEAGAPAARKIPGKKPNKDHRRRETADFSTINHLLDDSTASEDPAAAACPREQQPVGRGYDDNKDGAGLTRRESRSSSRGHRRRASSVAGVEAAAYEAAVDADDNGKTADFSAIYGLVGKSMPLTAGARDMADGGAAESPPDAAAIIPRVKHQSNQKPGRDSLAEELAEPRSVLPGGLGRIGGGGERDTGLFVRNAAATGTEKVRTPKHYISRKNPPDDRENLAMPTREAASRIGVDWLGHT